MYRVHEDQCVMIDCGSDTCKAGFSIDQFPKVVFRSGVSSADATPDEQLFNPKDAYVGDQAQTKRDVLALPCPIERGVVTNWDSMEKIWHHALYSELNAAPEEGNFVLLAEPPVKCDSTWEKSAEIMFETFQAPGLALANQATMALYSNGHTSGAVLACGHGVTHVVPIYRGEAQTDAIQRLELAGSDLTDFMATLIGRPGERKIARKIKERLCYVVLDYKADRAYRYTHEGKYKGTKYYEMPNHDYAEVWGSECPEALFQPSLLGLDYPGVHEAVYNSIMKCDPEMREQDNMFIIVLAGGSTLFDGMADRMEQEVTALAEPGTKVLIRAPPVRKYSEWVGGCELATLTTFANMWTSKQEYEEYGPGIVHSKKF